MGWTGFDKYHCEFYRNGRVDKKKTMDRELESWGTTVIKSAMGNGNWYGVIKAKNGSHYLVQILIEIRDGYFMYKEISDTMGPGLCECPASILDLADELCPCTEEYDDMGWAKDFRDECRENLRIKNSPTAFKNVKPGESVLWHVPENSGLMMDGESLAGKELRLTKVKGRRTWIHEGLWNTRIPTRYVNPSDCEPA